MFIHAFNTFSSKWEIVKGKLWGFTRSQDFWETYWAQPTQPKKQAAATARHIPTLICCLIAYITRCASRDSFIEFIYKKGHAKLNNKLLWHDTQDRHTSTVHLTLSAYGVHQRCFVNKLDSSIDSDGLLHSIHISWCRCDDTLNMETTCDG